MSREENSEGLYVGIEEPTEIRRALLESSKSMINILKSGEKLKAKREEKRKLTEELKGIMKELAELLRQLKSEFPKVKLGKLPKKAIARQEKIPVKEAKTEVTQPRLFPKIKPRELSDAEKLDRELSAIEEKLRKLE